MWYPMEGHSIEPFIPMDGDQVWKNPKTLKFHPKEKTLRKEKRKRKGGDTKFICEVFQISDGIAC
jgi:hypothetical protein